MRKRSDPARSAWYRLGRPGPLAAFRLSFASSKKKPPRKRRRKKKATSGPGIVRRKTLGEGFFSRVAPPPSHFPEGARPLWARWGRDRATASLARADDLDRMRIESIVDFLEGPDAAVSPRVMTQLKKIDPKRWFAVELVVSGYHQQEHDDQPVDSVPRRRIRFVGIGRRLWYKIANVAEVSEIEDASVRDVSGPLSKVQRARAHGLKEGNQAWALWELPTRDKVTLTSGSAWYGKGDYEAWRRERDKRKRKGRKRKGRGRHTYEQGTAIARADAAAMKRQLASDAKAERLRAAGDEAGARRIERRAKAARDAHNAKKGRKKTKRTRKPKKGKRR